MNFKKSKYSLLIDMIIPVVIIGIILSDILYSTIHIDRVRERYVGQLMTVFEEIIEVGCIESNGGKRVLNPIAISIIERLDTIDKKNVAIYYLNDDLKSLTVVSNTGGFIPKIGEDPSYGYILEKVLNEHNGYFTTREMGAKWHINFQWFNPENCDKTYLILHTVDQSIFEDPIVQILRYLNMIIFMGYWLKVNFIDRETYMKALQNNRDRLHSGFEYEADQFLDQHDTTRREK